MRSLFRMDIPPDPFWHRPSRSTRVSPRFLRNPWDTGMRATHGAQNTCTKAIVTYEAPIS